jgi:hypothetical protein
MMFYVCYISVILAYYLPFEYYCWQFVIIYLSVIIADNMFEYIFKILLLIHLLYIFEVLGTIVGTSWAEMHYDWNMSTIFLNYLFLLHHELFHTSNNCVIIIHASATALLYSVGCRWCVAKTDQLCPSDINTQAKEQKLQIYKLSSACWQRIKLKMHKDDKRHLLDKSTSLMKRCDIRHLSPAGGYLRGQVTVQHFLWNVFRE